MNLGPAPELLTAFGQAQDQSNAGRPRAMKCIIKDGKIVSDTNLPATTDAIADWEKIKAFAAGLTASIRALE